MREMIASRDLSLGEGERLQRTQMRRHIAVKGTLFTLGLGSGVYLGYTLVRTGLDLNAPWPPTIAILIAVLYVVAVLGGSLILDKSIDEVERHRGYKAVAAAGAAYMLVYPVWFLLWKAALVVEPIHWLLFIGFWLLLIASAVYYRFR
jgi:hypothetical protein